MRTKLVNALRAPNCLLLSAMAHAEPNISVIAAGMERAMAQRGSVSDEGRRLKEQQAPLSPKELEHLRMTAELKTLDASGMSNEQFCAALHDRGLERLLPMYAISAESVEAETERHVKAIVENLTVLGKILERHEAAIHKRWLKRSSKWRRGVMCEA